MPEEDHPVCALGMKAQALTKRVPSSKFIFTLSMTSRSTKRYHQVALDVLDAADHTRHYFAQLIIYSRIR